MSWSINAVGTPEKLIEYIDKMDESWGPSQSKDEYNAVKPALKALVGEIKTTGLVQLNASGHATFTNGEKTQGTVNVDLKTIYGTLL